jgi:hypothetical protein
MNRFGRFLALGFMFTASFAVRSAHAATPTPERVLIQINCKCEDAGGKAYLQVLNNQLAASGKFKLVEGVDPKSETIFHLDIVSSPLAPEAPGGPSRTGIAIVGKHNGATMEQSVETCNKIPLQACVELMLETLGTI